MAAFALNFDNSDSSLSLHCCTARLCSELRTSSLPWRLWTFSLPLVVNYLGLMHADQLFYFILFYLVGKKKMFHFYSSLSFPWKLLCATERKGIYIKKKQTVVILFLYWLLQRMILYFFLQITYSKNCLVLVHLKTKNQMGNLRHSYLNVILLLGYPC